ncbi:MAG: hypothetical protein KUG81_08680, partial [Gammaproteobacteria bacterium]|nr:hypothetical protein [Gammaproteobacteria bacterium]
IDYKDVFGDWADPLGELFKSDYMHNLEVFLDEIYKGRHSEAIPKKDQIFKSFQRVAFANLRVVILCEGTPSGARGNGVALSTDISHYLNPREETIAVEQCVEKTIYKGCNPAFDLTLDHWLNQGVMPVYTTLTGQFGKNHSALWRNFTREVIKGISDNSTGVVFILLGPKARYFRKFISETTHYVYEYHTPTYSLDRDQRWNCPAFKQVNELLKANNGKEFTINW